MIKQVQIKKSKIHGKGVFALRDFKKGKVVLKWHPKIISKVQVERLTVKQKSYLQKSGRRLYLMQSPEKFVNHSFNPNTYMKNDCDIAKKLIKRGEEITTHYDKEGLYFIKEIASSAI